MSSGELAPDVQPQSGSEGLDKISLDRLDQSRNTGDLNLGTKVLIPISSVSFAPLVSGSPPTFNISLNRQG